MVRKIKNTSKKGVTLAELVVIIAVLSIISTMVISFVVMTGESVRTGKQKVDALNDIAIVESIIDNFLTKELDNIDATEKKDLSLTISENKLITFDKTTKQLYSKIDDIENTYQSDTITNIQIIIKEKTINEKKEKIALCFVTYELAITNKTTKEYTYSFAVNPYEFNNEIIDTQQGGQ